MINLFVRILNMGVMASIVILVVFCVRGFMRRFPKKYVYALWLVVGIRLVCPVAVSSPVSLFNLDIVPQQVTLSPANEEELTGAKQDEFLENERGNEEENLQIGQYIQEKETTETENSVGILANSPAEQPMKSESNSEPIRDNRLERDTTTEKDANATIKNRILQTAAVIWLAGIALFFLWNIALILRMKQKIGKAVLYQDNIYECDQIASPFVMGLFRPRIYIPFRLEDGEREYILRHEKYHIRRRDYITKAVAFVITIVYWFHPLVWLSYVAMVRDMEMSCDEYVLTGIASDIRKDYSRSLLAFATNSRRFSMGMLAFGETGTRKRVKHILSFRQKGKWMGILAVFLVVVVAAVCLTNGRGKEVNEQKPKDVKEKIVASRTVHGYELRLLCKQDAQPDDTAFTGQKMIQGDFVLATYKEGKQQDTLRLTAFGEKNLPSFPEKFSLVVKDYDGDGSADDFALGQSLEDSVMSYRFYTVEENGCILPFTVSSLDPADYDYIVMENTSYSPELSVEDGMIRFKSYDSKKKKSKTEEINLVKKLDSKKSPESEREKLERLQNAVSETMPDRVVKESQKCVMKKIVDGENAASYLMANSEKPDQVTFRLDFSYQGNKLISYTCKEYGFVEGLPENQISEEDALVLVQKFAKAFLDRTLSKTEIRRDKTPEGEEGKYLYLTDLYGGGYVVQMDRGMVSRYALTKAHQAYKKSDIRIGYYASPGSSDMEYVTLQPEELGDEFPYWLGKLDPNDGCTAYTRKQWKKAKETGIEIEYNGYGWSIYQGGCVELLYSKDTDEKDLPFTVMINPKLCQIVRRYCKSVLHYEQIEPSEIKNIVSAELVYSEETAGKKSEPRIQRITDVNQLQTLEGILSKAEYVRGGSGCPFGNAVLTLRRKDGREIVLTWADDSCRMIRINGLFYKYMDQYLSFSPNGIRAIFDQIPWKGLDQ